MGIFDLIQAQQLSVLVPICVALTLNIVFLALQSRSKKPFPLISKIWMYVAVSTSLIVVTQAEPFLQSLMIASYFLCNITLLKLIARSAHSVPPIRAISTPMWISVIGAILLHSTGSSLQTTTLLLLCGTILPPYMAALQTTIHHWSHFRLSQRIIAALSLCTMAAEFSLVNLVSHPPFLGVVASGAVVFGIVLTILVMAEHVERQVERRQAITENLSTFTTLQEKLQPKVKTLPKFDIDVVYRPYQNMSGDYYDIIKTSHYTWVLIGDVTGHGIRSGIISLFTQSAVRGIIQTRPNISPKELVFALNKYLHSLQLDLDEGRPMSIAALRFNKNQNFVVSGAHDDLYIFRKRTQTIETVSINHFPLGIGFTELKNQNLFSEETFILEPGDIVTLCTDGLLEAPQNGNYESELFSESRLKEIVIQNAENNMTKLTQAIVTEVEEFTQNQIQDDLTIIGIKTFA